MSVTPFFYLERYSQDRKKWEIQAPLVWNYNHTKQEPADLYSYNGDHDLFGILQDDGFCDAPGMNGVHHGLPEDCDPYIKDEYEKCGMEIGGYNWDGKEVPKKKTYPNAAWFTYADMLIYCLQNPKVKDYDAMDEIINMNEDENTSVEPIYKDTPVMSLKRRVDAFMEVCDGWDWRNDYSLIRIVFWIQ